MYFTHEYCGSLISIISLLKTVGKEINQDLVDKKIL